MQIFYSLMTHQDLIALLTQFKTRISSLTPKSQQIETPISVLVVGDVTDNLMEAVVRSFDSWSNRTILEGEHAGMILKTVCTYAAIERALNLSTNKPDVVVLLAMYNDTRLPEPIIGKPEYNREKDGPLQLEQLRRVSSMIKVSCIISDC